MITFPAYTISFPSWYWVSLTKTATETKTQTVVQLQYLPTPSTDMPGIHTYIHTQTHIHISMCVFSLRIFNYIARRQRKKWKANLHKPKPQTTHTQAIKLKPIPTLPLLPPFLSLFSNIFSDCFLGLSWIICSPLCVSLFSTKRFVIELWHRNQFGIYSCSSCNWKLHKL